MRSATDLAERILRGSTIDQDDGAGFPPVRSRLYCSGERVIVAVVLLDLLNAVWIRLGSSLSTRAVVSVLRWWFSHVHQLYLIRVLQALYVSRIVYSPVAHVYLHRRLSSLRLNKSYMRHWNLADITFSIGCEANREARSW